MRLKILAAVGSALTLASATAAQAETAASSTLSLQTSVPKSCQMLTSSFTYTVAQSTEEQKVGDVKFSCNFVGTAQATINVPGGTKLVNSAASSSARYEIAWDIQPAGKAFRSSSASATAFSETFNATTGSTSNTEISGGVFLKLLELPTVAGNYQSIATYTIAP
jgi:hypothetical protein